MKKFFFAFFFQSTHQVGMKNVVKCYKDFFGYFNPLKTHCETPATFYLFHFLGPKQQDCQENEGNDNANVGVRTTIDTNIANDNDKGECPNVNHKSYNQ